MTQSEQQRKLGIAAVEALEGRFLAVTSTLARRSIGATFTPQWIVDMMLRRIQPSKFSIVIDAGAGPGRFTLAAAERLPRARVFAVESDATLAAGLKRIVSGTSARGRVRVLHDNFLEFSIPQSGTRLFLGNPPYIRHHALGTRQKAWLRKARMELHQPLSSLSGLHVYFLARALIEGRKGDALLMILPSEWLATRYGRAIKAAMLERCSAVRLLMFDSTTQIFANAMTTSVILQLNFGGSTRILDVATVDDRLGTRLRRVNVMLPEKGAHEANWLALASNALNPVPRSRAFASATVELGEVFAVHRGQVTGKNSVWIANAETELFIPNRFLYPCITDAREILDRKDGILFSTDSLRKVIDLPADLEPLASREREQVERFLILADRAGAADGYIARHRKPWWKVGLKSPPAVVMTYMARRAPHFVLNRAGARLINIAHGLYPRQAFSEAQLLGIVRWLNTNPLGQNGRTYAGGLIKLEPSDVCRIRIPDPRTFELAA